MDKSFTITLANNITEKEGINYLIKQEIGFFAIDLESKKLLLDQLKIDHRFSRSFDLIFVPNLKGTVIKQNQINAQLKDLLFIELKTTKKKLPENPKGFFFGATENEFNFAKLLGNKFRFCFVCLHPESPSHATLNLDELNAIIKNKRIQYQINL